MWSGPGGLRVPRGVTRLKVGERSLAENDHCERVGLVAGGGARPGDVSREVG